MQLIGNNNHHKSQLCGATQCSFTSYFLFWGSSSGCNEPASPRVPDLINGHCPVWLRKQSLYYIQNWVLPINSHTTGEWLPELRSLWCDQGNKNLNWCLSWGSRILEAGLVAMACINIYDFKRQTAHPDTQTKPWDALMMLSRPLSHKGSSGSNEFISNLGNTPRVTQQHPQ